MWKNHVKYYFPNSEIKEIKIKTIKIRNFLENNFLNLKIDSFSIDVEGLVNIRDLNKKFSWNLLDDEASTIGGFVINLTKRIPLYGEIINFENYTFKILSHSRKKIIRLNIKKTNN